MAGDEKIKTVNENRSVPETVCLKLTSRLVPPGEVPLLGTHLDWMSHCSSSTDRPAINVSAPGRRGES